MKLRKALMMMPCLKSKLKGKGGRKFQHVLLHLFCREIKLFKVEDENVTEVSGIPLRQEMLESDVCLKCKNRGSYDKISGFFHSCCGSIRSVHLAWKG